MGEPTRNVVVACSCPEGPYLGAQKAGTPVTCERCGFLTSEQLDELRGQPSAEKDAPFYFDKTTGEPCPREGGLLCTLPWTPEHRHSTTRVFPPADMCHNGHPFVPGVSTDHAPGESDPRWCNKTRVLPPGWSREDG